MSDIRIRRATDADAPAILDIYNEAVLNSTASWDFETVDLAERLGWLRRHNTGRYETYVAESDDGIVGFAGYREFRAKIGYRDTAEHTIYIEAGHRGQGTGRRLLQCLIEAARGNGFHVLVGGLSSDNEGSLVLHERFGFAEVARMPQVGQKFGRWLDLVFLQLVLDDRAEPGGA